MLCARVWDSCGVSADVTYAGSGQVTSWRSFAGVRVYAALFRLYYLFRRTSFLSSKPFHPSSSLPDFTIRRILFNLKLLPFHLQTLVLDLFLPHPLARY